MGPIVAMLHPFRQWSFTSTRQQETQPPLWEAEGRIIHYKGYAKEMERTGMLADDKLTLNALLSVPRLWLPGHISYQRHHHQLSWRDLCRWYRFDCNPPESYYSGSGAQRAREVSKRMGSRAECHRWSLKSRKMQIDTHGLLLQGRQVEVCCATRPRHQDTLT